MIGPLSLLRSFKYLAWSSIVGNVGVASAIVVIIVLGCKDYSNLEPRQNPWTLPAYDFLHFPQVQQSPTHRLLPILQRSLMVSACCALLPSSAICDWLLSSHMSSLVPVLQYFGAAAFLFAIHLVILPISQSMQEPQQFKKVSIAALYCCIALLCHCPAVLQCCPAVLPVLHCCATVLLYCLNTVMALRPARVHHIAL